MQSQSYFRPTGPRAQQDSTGKQAQDHGCQSRDEAQCRVTAAIAQKRLHAGEQVQKPSVKRPGQVAVLVPVRGESAGMVRPVGWNPTAEKSKSLPGAG